MKIAVPSTGPEGLESEISMHFGRAPYYTFVEIENGEIKNVETIAVPFAEHGPGDLPNFVREHGGEVGDVVRAFIQQSLETDSRWKEKIEEDKHGDEHGHN